MRSIDLIRDNTRLLVFGMIMSAYSSFGQTFFISLFSSEIRDAFSLSHGDFGSLYAAATLSSAAMILAVGWTIDRYGLRLFACIVLAGLAAASAAMSVVTGVVALGVTVFALRFFGQGLVSHAAIVAMGRYFDRARGRAIAISSLGFTACEMFLPPLVVLMLGLMGWQAIWQSAAVFLVVIAMPTIYWILSPYAQAPDRHDKSGSGHSNEDWTLRQALGDVGLYLRAPSILATSAIGTALVFHQIHIGETKGWSLGLIAASFSLYALASALTTILAGFAVDRVTARRLQPFFLIPLAATCTLLATTSLVLSAPVFYFMLGVSSGAYFGVNGAIWAELYGTRHLGAIRSLMHTAMVFASGVAPAVFGILFDWNISTEAIAWGCAAYCVAASLLSACANMPRRTMLTG